MNLRKNVLLSNFHVRKTHVQHNSVGCRAGPRSRRTSRPKLESLDKNSRRLATSPISPNFPSFGTTRVPAVQVRRRGEGRGGAGRAAPGLPGAEPGGARAGPGRAGARRRAGDQVLGGPAANFLGWI